MNKNQPRRHRCLGFTWDDWFLGKMHIVPMKRFFLKCLLNDQVLGNKNQLPELWIIYLVKANKSDKDFIANESINIQQVKKCWAMNKILTNKNQKNQSIEKMNRLFFPEHDFVGREEMLLNESRSIESNQVNCRGSRWK